MIKMHTKLILLLLLIGAGVMSCSKNNEEPDDEGLYEVTFELPHFPTENNSRLAKENDFEVLILLAAYNDLSDSLFYNKVKLRTVNGKMVTEPIKFGKGEVDLMSFVIYQNNEIYALAPRKHSIKAAEVAQPLPYFVKASKSKPVAMEAPEVILLNDGNPRDFGY
jgi:hypothetical protein